MTPLLSVGTTEIPLDIRHSPRARHLRIVVRPGSVVAVAPSFVTRRRIMAYVESKRHWIRDKVESIGRRPLLGEPERFITGARVQFRGRALRLSVSSAELQTPTLRFASAFHVRVPRSIGGAAREAMVRERVMSWLIDRARRDVEDWVRRHGRRLGVQPTRIRIGNQKTLWGSCSARGVISLNWRLIGAPKAVFEYVVVHELCHLLERGHDARFWTLVESVLPDYRRRREWLKGRGIAVS